jgi:hypothetical protein
LHTWHHKQIPDIFTAKTYKIPYTNYVIILDITVSVVLSVNFGDYDEDVNWSKSDERYEKCYLSANHTTNQCTLNEETASWEDATLTVQFSIYLQY